MQVLDARCLNAEKFIDFGPFLTDFTEQTRIPTTYVQGSKEIDLKANIDPKVLFDLLMYFSDRIEAKTR